MHFLSPKKSEVQSTINHHGLYLQLTAMVSSDTYWSEMEEQTSRSQDHPEVSLYGITL